MDIEKLIETLDNLRNQYNNLSGSAIKVENLERLGSLRTEILVAERQLAAARNESYAIDWRWPVDWAFSIFQPVVVSNGKRTLLMYSAQNNESASKENKKQSQFTAILTFKSCEGCKFGDPNDETIEGHPLYGRGIDVGGAYNIMNSNWLEELKKINSVHPQYDEQSWSGKKHYLLFFKDNAFECVANDVSSHVKEGTLPEIISAEVGLLFQRR